MTDYVYKGIPIERDGVIVAVQPVRSIKAPNGKHYRGVLDIDKRGNEFVYRQYPNNATPPPVGNMEYYTSEVLRLIANGSRFLLSEIGDRYISRYTGAEFDEAIETLLSI